MPDDLLIFQSQSNDAVVHKLDMLPVGISKIRLHFPKRLLAPGSFAGRCVLIDTLYNWHNIDTVQPCMTFDIVDNRTQWGKRRAGFFSTLIDWEILDNEKR